MAYTKPHRWKIEECERLRGSRNQIKFIDVIVERWQVATFRKQEGGKMFYKLYVLGMIDDLWDEVRGLGSETWEGFEWVEHLVVPTRFRRTGIIALFDRDAPLSRVFTKAF